MRLASAWLCAAAAISLAACRGTDEPNEGLGSARSVLDPDVVIGEVEGDAVYTFGDIRSVAADDEGRIYVGDRIGATVRVYSARGEFIEEVGDPRPLSPKERSDSLSALQARIDSLPVRLEDVVNLGRGIAERRLPEVVPTVMSVRVVPDGLVWVERWPDVGSGGSRFYDIYDSTGVQRASVQLRAPLLSEPPPFIGRRAIVGVTRDEETGVHRVVRFSLKGLLHEW